MHPPSAGTRLPQDDRKDGPLTHITGVTGTGRGVRLTVQAAKLPMTLVDVWADTEARLS